MAAGRPEAPAPTMTTSATWSHRIRPCGAARLSDVPTPVRAVTPTPSTSPVLMNFLRLTLKFLGFLLISFCLLVLGSAMRLVPCFFPDRLGFGRGEILEERLCRRRIARVLGYESDNRNGRRDLAR